MFNLIVMQRPLWMQWLLERGYEVVQSDLDIVWLRDPLPYLQQRGVCSRHSAARLCSRRS